MTGQVAGTGEPSPKSDPNRLGRPGADGALRMVLIGGGHGLATALSGLKRSDVSVTAIVSTADDGGSSGRLRASFGGHAPGDARRCLLALADESNFAAALERRFEESELAGHVVGNLLITSLADVTGDFAVALDEVAKLLGAAGRVLPASVDPVDLGAMTARGAVEGEVSVSASGAVRQVWIEPSTAEAHPASVEAILNADQVVYGPGSLYTSVLAALIVPGIADALQQATAHRVYVCNVAHQKRETEGFDAADHLDALIDHGIPVDSMLVDSSGMALGNARRRLVDRPLVADNGHAHDPDLLADALVELGHSDGRTAAVSGDLPAISSGASPKSR